MYILINKELMYSIPTFKEEKLLNFFIKTIKTSVG